jgi:hypothetical protein
MELTKLHSENVIKFGEFYLQLLILLLSPSGSNKPSYFLRPTALEKERKETRHTHSTTN